MHGVWSRRSNSGTYTEGDFQIGADGLKLGMENLQISSAASSRYDGTPDATKWIA